MSVETIYVYVSLHHHYHHYRLIDQIMQNAPKLSQPQQEYDDDLRNN